MRSFRRPFVPTLVLVAALTGCSAPAPSTSAPSRTAPTPEASAPSAATTAGTVPAVVRIADMSVPRAVQSSTLLADGRILIAGGCTTTGCDIGSAGGATAEIYDPSTRTFTPTDPMSISRDDHAAVLLPDGRVLLAGGWTADGVTATTEIFDPRTETFGRGPDMKSPRAGITPVALDDGRVLLAGGFTDNRPTVASADLFDPATDTIAPTGPMAVPRGAYAATLMPDGRVLVAGGLADGVVVASAEAFDPATGSFGSVGPMATARYKAGSVALLDGRPIVIGGSGDIEGQALYGSTEVFDAATGAFAPGPSMGQARYKLVNAVVLLDDGGVVVAGGADRPEIYDPAVGTFHPVEGRLDATRLFLTATPIDGRGVLLVGGYDEAIEPTAAAWVVE